LCTVCIGGHDVSRHTDAVMVEGIRILKYLREFLLRCDEKRAIVWTARKIQQT
jgi:hypothetical protein